MKTEAMEKTALTIEVSMIALDAVRPSPVNPRNFAGKEAAIAELAENIARVGLIQPITVRPVTGKKVKYEIVAGERRYRAYQVLAGTHPELFAGQKTPGIPAFVREITDAEANELTVVENLQREDLSPLEEAAGIATLLDRGMTHEEIADKLARPVGWVAKRAKIRDLSPEWKKAIADPESAFSSWSAGHLEMVAKFSLSVQEMIYENFTGRFQYSPGMLRGVSKGDLKEQLDGYLYKLSAAPWSFDGFVNADHGTAAIPCCFCDKRSSVQPNLFDDPDAAVKRDKCLDKVCFGTRLEAFLVKKIEDLKNTHPRLLLWRGDGFRMLLKESALNARSLEEQYCYKDAKKDDPEASPALIIDGKGVGTVKWVKLEDFAKSRALARPVDAEGNALPKPLSERREGLQKRRNKALLERALGMIEKEAETPELTLRLEDMQILRYIAASDLPRGHLMIFPKMSEFIAYVDQGQDAGPNPRRPFLIRLLQRALDALEDELRSAIMYSCQPGNAELAYWLLGLDVEEARREIAAEIPEPKSWASLNEDGTPKRKAS